MIEPPRLTSASGSQEQGLLLARMISVSPSAVTLTELQAALRSVRRQIRDVEGGAPPMETLQRALTLLERARSAGTSPSLIELEMRLASTWRIRS